VLHVYGHSGDSQSHNLYSLSELEEVMLFLPQQSATKTRDTVVNEAEYEAVLLENSVAVFTQIYDKYLCPNSSSQK
jgi:hypothetical protein